MYTTKTVDKTEKYEKKLFLLWIVSLIFKNETENNVFSRSFIRYQHPHFFFCIFLFLVHPYKILSNKFSIFMCVVCLIAHYYFFDFYVFLFRNFVIPK